MIEHIGGKKSLMSRARTKQDKFLLYVNDSDFNTESIWPESKISLMRLVTKNNV